MTRLLLDSVPDPPATVEVAGAELRYLTRVRRHRAGDEIEVRDAQGRRFAARVGSLSRDRAELFLEQELPAAPDTWPIALLVAVPKGSRLDDVVRKLNELGVAELVPTIAERSNTRPGAGRVERWRRIADESTRQCGRREPLRIGDVTPLVEALERFSAAEHKLALDPATGERGLATALANARGASSIAIAVGPEGGFTISEIDTMRRVGFDVTSLGSSILRVETAAIAAATLAVAFAGGFD